MGVQDVMNYILALKRSRAQLLTDTDIADMEALLVASAWSGFLGQTISVSVRSLAGVTW